MNTKLQVPKVRSELKLWITKNSLNSLRNVHENLL